MLPLHAGEKEQPKQQEKLVRSVVWFWTGMCDYVHVLNGSFSCCCNHSKKLHVYINLYSLSLFIPWFPSLSFPPYPLPIPSPPPCLPIPSSPSPSLLLARRRGRYSTLRGTMRRSSASRKVLSLISLTPSMRTGWRACWDRPEESSPAAMYRSACVSECVSASV